MKRLPFGRRPKRVDAFVEATLRDRRPPRFPAEDDEAREMLAAASLHAGRPGADAPRPEFVARLEAQLRRQVERDDAGAAAATVSRRALLGGAAATAAAAAAVAVGVDHVVSRGGVTGGSGGTAGELVPHEGRWVDVAALADVPVGRPLRFSAGAIEGFVVNHGDRVAAVSAICTHLPCSLVANPSRQRLDCPCHGAWFDFEGRPVASAYYAASLPPLPALRSRVVGDRIEVFTA